MNWGNVSSTPTWFEPGSLRKFFMRFAARLGLMSTTLPLDDNDDLLTKILKGVIKIEKKHIYGLDKTSAAKRRDEIFNYLENTIKD